MKNEIEMLKYIQKTAIDGKIGIDIETRNKKTEGYGCAILLKTEGMIKVFEGNGDGSDDKEMTYEEFIENYRYQISIIK